MIRAKLVLRNVINKPLRSAIIILSLAAAAFAALFCISGIHTAQNGLRDFFSSRYGDVDIIITNSHNEVTLAQKDFPSGSRVIGQGLGKVSFTFPNTRYFNYVSKTEVSVIGLDTQLAHELHMIDSALPTEGGVTITQPLANLLKKEVGDTFTFTGNDGVEFEQKILAITPATKFLNATPIAIVCTPDFCCKVAGTTPGSFQLMFADVPDEQVAETIHTLSEKYPDHHCFGTTSADSEGSMDSMLNIYYLIFAVVFLMICFIVVSMSKHIVNERMSVIGMLRSIGGSIHSTGMLLLCESAFYGLCGGVLGVLLFLPMRSSTNLGLFAAVGEDISHTDGINILTICLVILAIILIQVVFSAAAIMKAARTPVRDIIFGTKETAYIPSDRLFIAGILMFAISIVVFCFFDDFFTTVAAAFCSAVGAVILFPKLIRLLTDWLAVIFGNRNMPVAKLAAKEIASTKSSISSAQLILSSMSLTIAMVVLASSILHMLSAPVYHSDLLITNPEQEGMQYDYIARNVDGVQDVEKIYFTYLQYETQAQVNGENRDLVVTAYPKDGYRYFDGICDLPDSLADNEAAIDKVLAGRLSLHTGDEITLKLRTEKYLPIEKKLKISCLIDAGYFNTMGNTLLLNDNVYKSIYFDDPAMVLIKTDPGKTASVLDTLRSTIADEPDSLKTLEQYQQEFTENMSSILTIVYAVILLGLALSLMGTSSNMLMGFEQSRRKYAVYYASSMSKEQLKKLIWSETLLISSISVISSILYAMYFLLILSKALSLLEMSVPLVHPVLYAVLFGAAAFAILMVVAVRPLRALSKMNIAEEIKTSAD